MGDLPWYKVNKSPSTNPRCWQALRNVKEKPNDHRPWSRVCFFFFKSVFTALALGSVAIVKVSGQTSPLLFFGPCTTWDVYKILQLNSLFSKHGSIFHASSFFTHFFPVSFKDPLKEVSSSTHHFHHPRRRHCIRRKRLLAKTPKRSVSPKENTSSIRRWRNVCLDVPGS